MGVERSTIRGRDDQVIETKSPALTEVVTADGRSWDVSHYAFSVNRESNWAVIVELREGDKK